MKNSFKTAFIAVASIVVGTSVQAAELIAGNCYDTASVNKAALNEGQHSYIIANSAPVVKGEPKEIRVVSANAAGNGYLFFGDKPIGEKSTKMCVFATLGDFRLVDINDQMLDPTLKLGGNRELALKACETNKLGNSCGFHDDAIVAGFKNGIHPIFQAKVLAQVFDKQNNDYVISIGASPNSDMPGTLDGGIELTNSIGKFVDYSPLGSIDYTVAGKTKLKEQNKTDQGSALKIAPN